MAHQHARSVRVGGETRLWDGRLGCMPSSGWPMGREVFLQTPVRN